MESYLKRRTIIIGVTQTGVWTLFFLALTKTTIPQVFKLEALGLLIILAISASCLNLWWYRRTLRFLSQKVQHDHTPTP